MTRNPYADFCLGIQATRRHFESLRTPLASAAGVAASLYTHQLANVLRVLTDVRVRHLLADEVGLGKTVQALMILNALRYQRRTLSALVVVPDRLVTQWRDEIMTRAHTAPIGEAGGVEGGQYIRLAWEAQLRMTDAAGNAQLTLADIDPGRYDVLIVDELHHLRGDVQDRIVRVAAGFSHLLVLTATPAFQRPARHAQLFALLEPERTALARWRIARSARGMEEQLSTGDDLSKWPEWAAAAVVEAILGRDSVAAADSTDAALPASALAHCAYRRFIRTRRTDYGGVLPRRRHIPLVVEPLGAEADRQALMWRYFSYLDQLNRRFDPVLLAKRVILSPPSLEQRVDFLRREGHERGGLLDQVKPLVRKHQGDSRADALVDLLAGIWSHDASERVLVAAQDNLTVDYLFDLVRARLPLVGPVFKRVPLVAARVRQGMMTEAVENLGGLGNETTENLEAFQRGQAQVLFAPESAQVGLNLQCARVLVLYSVPWRPEEVEQWIGRLDRIGNTAAFSKLGEAKSIDVYTVTQRGLVDDKVVGVLQRFRVFESSVNLDGEHLEEVAGLIEAAALRPDSVNWRQLEYRTEAMAAEDEVQELASALRPHLPWSVSTAVREHRLLEALPPAPPALKVLSGPAATGPRAWDRAFEGMLKLLRRAGEYHIRWNTDLEGGSDFQTLWYKFGEQGMYGRRTVHSRVDFSFGADPGHERSPRFAHAFITRRGDIGTPPRRSVTMSLNGEAVRRPLRFLNFGDALHDELVSGWLPQDNGPVLLEVAYPADHSIWKHGAAGLYLVRVAIIDPASILLDRGVKDRTLESIARSATRMSAERLPAALEPFLEAVNCALEADVRWLRAQLSATIHLDCRRWDGSQWATAGVEETRALLDPMAHTGTGLPPSAALRASEEAASAASAELRRVRGGDTMAARESWSGQLASFQSSLCVRLLVVREEGRDATAVAREDLARAEDGLTLALERGNRAQITRAENARDHAADVLQMTEVLWQERCHWLQECEEYVRIPMPHEYLVGLLRARPPL